MKKYKNILFSVGNVLVIVFLFCFIVFGLNRIGILELPGFIQNIFQKDSGNQEISISDDSKIYSSLNEDSPGNESQVVSRLTSDNVRKLLENVKLYDNYYHEVVKTVYSGDESSVINAVVRRTDGLSEVSVYDKANNLVRRIKEQEDSVIIVKQGADASEISTTLPKGNITIEQESGVIMTHKDFLDSDFVLDDASFVLETGDYGSVLKITFETQNGKYLQTQEYTLSLDYGVVISAQCYENGELIYSLETKTLSSNAG